MSTEHRISVRIVGTPELRLDRFTRMERDISTLFDRLFAPAHPFRPVAENGWHPFTDVYETADSFLIRMELAGVDPASLEVAKEGRCLVVRGRRDDRLSCQQVACHQLEISYGPFERLICLPVDFQEDSVHAEYGSAQGLFEIRIRKENR